jgi:hypothetical protein
MKLSQCLGARSGFMARGRLLRAVVFVGSRSVDGSRLPSTSGSAWIGVLLAGCLAILAIASLGTAFAALGPGLGSHVIRNGRDADLSQAARPSRVDRACSPPTSVNSTTTVPLISVAHSSAMCGGKIYRRGRITRGIAVTVPPRVLDPVSDRAPDVASGRDTVGPATLPSGPPPDGVSPSTSITSGPGATTTSTEARLSFRSNESNSTFECQGDSGAWESCTSPKTYSGLALGPHQFSVRATDAAGNVDPTPAGWSWTIIPPPAAPTSPPLCDSTVASAAAAQSAVGAAAPGKTVCLADGTYGNINLSASKPAPGVTLAAANPGSAIIGSVQVSGSGYTISQFVIDGGVTIARNTDRTVVQHNRILSGDHYGVFVCTATPPDQCDDTKIVGNLFDGAMNEDQIRANLFHDADGDGIGLLVEGNEFRGNTERGGHNDVFQSVWVGDHLVFRKNYLHDFGGQGFFVKDQDTAINGFIANDNLIVDQDLPCEPSSLCTGYQLSPWQIYGPIADGEMRNNTVGWGAGGGTAVLTGDYENIDFSNNVFDRLSSTNGGGRVPTLIGSGNTYCNSSGWAVPAGTTEDCSPAFLDPAAGDYRLASGRGVSWTPAEQHYGP